MERVGAGAGAKAPSTGDPRRQARAGCLLDLRSWDEMPALARTE